MKQQIIILDQEAIQRKLLRMAYQLWELHSREKKLVIIGVEGSGVVVAKQLAALVEKISPLKVELHSLQLHKKNPLSRPIKLEVNLSQQSVVLVDDVAKSGKTLMYALKPLLDTDPASVKIAVLVDRKHKSFPIVPDIVGHSIATTLQDHIEVVCEGDDIVAAYLE